MVTVYLKNGKIHEYQNAYFICGKELPGIYAVYDRSGTRIASYPIESVYGITSITPTIKEDLFGD